MVSPQFEGKTLLQRHRLVRWVPGAQSMGYGCQERKSACLVQLTLNGLIQMASYRKGSGHPVLSGHACTQVRVQMVSREH